MGFFVEGLARCDKAQQLADRYPGTVVLPQAPASFSEVPADKGLICVVGNMGFEAAGFIFDARELERCLPSPRDTRQRTFLLLDRKVAEEISGFAKFKAESAL